MRTAFAAALLLLAPLAAGDARAQTASSPAVAAPNGLDAVRQAAALLKDNPAYRATEARDATLSVRRAALADPKVTRALALARGGLDRPFVFPPAADIFPEFADCRTLARLLAVEIEVAFADGRTRAALQSLGDGLRLGYAVKRVNLLGALVGQAVDGIVLNAFARHLDQLSARDCELLLAQTRRHLARPDTVPEMMRAEREYARRTALDPLREGLSRPPSEEDLRRLEAESGPQVREEYRALASDPQRRERFLAELDARFDAAYSAAETHLRPGAVVAPSAAPTPTAPSSPLIAQMMSVFDGSTRDLYVRQANQERRGVALVRLLGVHAAVRRWRWEQNRYPDTLEPLNLGALAADPFTGKPFEYRLRDEGTAYTLTSVGPPTIDAQGRETGDGKRTPVTLPLAPRPPVPAQSESKPGA